MASRRPLRSATEWQALILQQAESGLSAKAFCAQHDITYASFTNWRRRLGDNASPEPSDESLPMFVELTKSSGQVEPRRSWLIELDLGAGIQLRLLGRTDAATREPSARVAQLEHQMALLQRLVFAQKSERQFPPKPDQLMLGEMFNAPEAQPEPEKQTITYERGKAPKVRPDGCVSDSGLRFDESVPVKTIELSLPEIAGLDADQYEIIDVKVTHRLAQRPASYVMLRYERPVVKLIET